MILFGLVSCTKTNVIREGKELSSAGSLISGDVNLDSFETVFDYDSTTGDLNVIFSEPEDIDINPNQLTDIGLSSLVLSKGIYNISVLSGGYGTVTFNIKSYSVVAGSAVVPEGTLSMGIRIAKRWTYCGECCSGIGFRCGWIPNSPAPSTPYFVSSDYSIDLASGKFTLLFTSSINLLDVQLGL